MTATSPALRRAGSLVLAMEAVVVFFFTLAVFGLQLVDRGVVFFVGFGVIALIGVCVGLLGRSIGYALGWAIQVGLIGLGFLHSMMFIVGVVFAAMWVYVVVVSRRSDAEAARIANDLNG